MKSVSDRTLQSREGGGTDGGKDSSSPALGAGHSGPCAALQVEGAEDRKASGLLCFRQEFPSFGGDKLSLVFKQIKTMKEHFLFAI